MAEVSAEWWSLPIYFLEAAVALIYMFPKYEFPAQCVIIKIKTKSPELKQLCGLTPAEAMAVGRALSLEQCFPTYS